MWDAADDYDWATGCFTDDIPYWEWLVDQVKPRQVLELACGTGRISLPLCAAAGRHHADLRYVGLDSSSSFLAKARERFADVQTATNVDISFVTGDMRTFAFESTFDLIILGYNTLAFLHTIDDQLACLRAVRQHLAPGGRFAIDMYAPDYSLLAEAGGTYPTLRQDVTCDQPDPAVRRFRSSYVARYNAATQTEDSTHYWEFYLNNGDHKSTFHDLSWHTFFPRELELLLRIAGLSVVHRFGSYDRQPFESVPSQYLWVMQAA